MRPPVSSTTVACGTSDTKFMSVILGTLHAVAMVLVSATMQPKPCYGIYDQRGVLGYNNMQLH